MHCQWGRKPPKLPSPVGISSPGRIGGPSHGHRQHAQTFGKDHACGSWDILTDRQTDRHTDTHADVIITIRGHRSRGRSNNVKNHSISKSKHLTVLRELYMRNKWHGLFSSPFRTLLPCNNNSALNSKIKDQFHEPHTAYGNSVIAKQNIGLCYLDYYSDKINNYNGCKVMTADRVG